MPPAIPRRVEHLLHRMHMLAERCTGALQLRRTWLTWSSGLRKIGRPVLYCCTCAATDDPLCGITLSVVAQLEVYMTTFLKTMIACAHEAATYMQSLGGQTSACSECAACASPYGAVKGALQQPLLVCKARAQAPGSRLNDWPAVQRGGQCSCTRGAQRDLEHQAHKACCSWCLL